MPTPLRKIDDQAINAKKVVTNIRRGGYAYQVFDRQPVFHLANAASAIPTGAGPNAMSCAGGAFPLYAEYAALGTQTILSPKHVVGSGLDLQQDATDNDGSQWIFGGALDALNEFATVIGTDDNPFIRVKFKIEDVSGTDDCAFGFRKFEASQANIDDYDEMACINVISGNIFVETILNAAATVSTDSGQDWADNATHEFEVRLVGCTAVYYLNGTPLTGIPVYNFDVGEVVLPFGYLLQATDLTSIWLVEMELGRVKDKDTLGRG